MSRSKLATLIWLLVLTAHVSPARADICSAYVTMTDAEADQLAARLGGQGSMPRLLARLESIDGCAILQHVNRRLDMRFQEHRRLRAALLVVATIGRGATTDPDVVTQASQLAGQLTFNSDRRALLTYITDKLMARSNAEPLTAFVQGHIPDRDLQALATGITATIPAGPWQPPGDQPRWFYVGNQAHTAIGQYYRDTNHQSTVRLNDKPISSILMELRQRGVGPATNLRTKAVGSLALRPDIVNLDTLEIYEIKPAAAQAAAATRVAEYIAAFASAGVTLRPGRPNAPGTSGVVPAPDGHYRFYSPQAGVIAYEYRHGDYVPVLAPGRNTSEDTDNERLPVTTRLVITPRPLRIARSVLETYRDQMAAATGLSGAALVAYIVISTGTRAFPPRNAIPAP